MRVLRNADADATGGGAAETAAAETKAATPTPTPTAAAAAPPPAPATIALTPEEYRRHLDNEARLRDIEAEKAREIEAKEQARLKAMAEKGQAEEAMAQLRTSKDAEIQKERDGRLALEREILNDRKALVVGKALDGVEWVSAEAAADARTILENRFEAVRDSATGAVTVREKGTGRPAADVIKEWRAAPASAHYQRATTTGGAGAGGTHKAGGTEPPDDPIARQLKAVVAQKRTGAPGLAGTYGTN